MRGTQAHTLTDEDLAKLDKIAERPKEMMATLVEDFLVKCVKRRFELRVAAAALALLLLQTAVKVLMIGSRVPAEEIPSKAVSAIASELQELLADKVNQVIRQMERDHIEGN